MRKESYQHYFTHQFVKLGTYSLDRNQEQPKVKEYIQTQNVKFANATILAMGCLEYKEHSSKSSKPIMV